VNKNRVERTSANDLTEVQENASELVRSVGDVAGKFIKEQPITRGGGHVNSRPTVAPVRPQNRAIDARSAITI